jgi:hypothetical protein
MNKFTKQMLMVVAMLISFWASGQNLISPITINIPANPPANMAEWATAVPPVMILAQTKLVNGQINGMVQESRILVTIKSAGNKVCGTYTAQTAPMSNFNSANKNWKGAELLSLLGQECTLKPGSYELCVQFYSLNGASSARILGESCKSFTIADKKDKETFSPPTNVSPVNEKKFTEKEIAAPLTFRWTPIVPKPKVPVTYRLRVWQLMQGQNSSAAIKSNTAIVDKEVTNITQALITNIYTGPCKPPYLCDYVWNVEASKKNQMGEVEMLGTSEPTTFKSATNNVDIQIDSLKFGCCENGKQSIYIKVRNNRPTAADIVSIKYKVNGVGAAIALTPLSPTLPINMVGNATQVFTASINCINNANFIKILVDAEATLDPDNTETEVASDTLICACNLCDTNVVKWTLPAQINYNSNVTNNVAALSGPISFGPYPIVKLSTEIVDFYWYTEGDCKKCNTNDYYFGNLIGGSLTSMVGGTSVAGPGGIPIPSSHQLDFISPTMSGVALSNNINLNISLPPQTQLSCCTDCFRFCIRYTATFMQNGVCKTCSIVKCYETKRVHKKVGLQMYPPLNDCGERGQIIVKDKTGIKEN